MCQEQRKELQLGSCQTSALGFVQDLTSLPHKLAKKIWSLECWGARYNNDKNRQKAAVPVSILLFKAQDLLGPGKREILACQTTCGGGVQVSDALTFGILFGALQILL